MRSIPLCSTIFDDPEAGNLLKDKRICGELKECVSVNARTKQFSLKKGKSTVIAKRKQFPIKLSHVITVHKSQGSTCSLGTFSQ